VFVGGGCGATLRYAAGQAYKHVDTTRPYVCTIVINVVGSFLMGTLTQILLERSKAEGAAGAEEREKWRLLLAVGALGGFTTFSSFSLEATTLIQKAAYGEAILYVTSSTLLGLLALLLGVYLMRGVGMAGEGEGE